MVLQSVHDLFGMALLIFERFMGLYPFGSIINEGYTGGGKGKFQTQKSPH